jgi:hypothetical protein
MTVHPLMCGCSSHHVRVDFVRDELYWLVLVILEMGVM